MAYCRSKLGLNWVFYQCREKYPNLWMNLVHPGVVNSELVGSSSSGVFAFIKKNTLIDAHQGAQTTLICSTALILEDRVTETSSSLRSSNIATVRLENGAYYHNSCGKMILHPEDPARNVEKATRLWQELEEICSPYLSSNSNSNSNSSSIGRVLVS
jgi:hypothetical protein